MKVMLVISYDGSKFCGFQRQKDVRNVQGYLEDNLSKYFNEKIEIKGAGRTDRGVHAKYQVVHFETKKDVNSLKVVNKNLKDLKIKKVKIVDDNFHARHSVKKKTYLYKLDISGKRNKNYYGVCTYDLDMNKIKEASNILKGTHNFKNFVSGEREDYNSTILNIKIYKINKCIYFKFDGVGFYRYMVRNLVGALLEVGKGKIDKSMLEFMLENPEIDKKLPTASPNGLYLTKIMY